MNLNFAIRLLLAFQYLSSCVAGAQPCSSGLSGVPTSYFTVSSGATYHYIHITPKSGSKNPYIVFLHGFPSLGREWHHQISYFSRLGYGIIVPDLLGYGGTSKPNHVDEYKMKRMSFDIVDILNYEGIEAVHGVAHDFGSTLLSHLAVYAPRRFLSYSFLSLGYSAPGFKFDVHAINRNARKEHGYATLGYFLYLNQTRAIADLNDNDYSMLTITYAANSTLEKTDFAPVGKLKAWLLANRTTEIGSWYSKTDQAAHNCAYSQNGGYYAPLNWYKAPLINIDYPEEQNITDKQRNLKKPVLLLSGKRDPVLYTNDQVASTKPYAADLRVVQLDTGHWIFLEAPGQVNREIHKFYKSIE